MKTLANGGFSTAIFGPAWTHEHFSTSSLIHDPWGNTISTANAVDQSLWEGFALPEELGCDCRKGRPHHIKDYKLNPIIKSAREYPAGSISFLETNFSRAYILKVEQESGVCLPFHCLRSTYTMDSADRSIVLGPSLDTIRFGFA